MTLKIAREIAAQLREQENEDDDISIAAVVLDDRVAELEAQRDALLEVCRNVKNGLENVHLDMLQAEIAKYDKDLPGFKDITGLYVDETEGVALGEK